MANKMHEKKKKFKKNKEGPETGVVLSYMLHKEARTGRLLIKVRVSRTFINKLFRRAKRGE